MGTIGLGGLLYLVFRHGQYLGVYPDGVMKRPGVLPPPNCLVLKTCDGANLHCSLYMARDGAGSADTPAKGSVILFHGNGVIVEEVCPLGEEISARGYHVLLAEYRGYGTSDGYPGEKRLRTDAQTALNYVKEHAVLSKSPIIIFGQSLGGAVAVDLVSRNPSDVYALILENTFLSLPEVVRRLPVIGLLYFLCHQRWNSASKMPKIPASIPILMLSGARDALVPPEHMAKLWTIAQKRGNTDKKATEIDEATAPKHDTFVTFPYAQHHNMALFDEYSVEIENFLEKLRNASGDEPSQKSDDASLPEIATPLAPTSPNS